MAAYDYNEGFDKASGRGKKPLEESAKAYEAFVTYCELGRERSTGKTAKVVGCSSSTLSKYYQRYNWKERSAFYDADKVKERFKDVRAEKEAHHRRQIQIFRDDQERRAKALGNLGDLMLDVAVEKIENMRAAGDQISEQSLSNIAKTVASLHEMSMNLGATALGIDELEAALDAELED